MTRPQHYTPSVETAAKLLVHGFRCGCGAREASTTDCPRASTPSLSPSAQPNVHTQADQTCKMNRPMERSHGPLSHFSKENARPPRRGPTQPNEVSKHHANHKQKSHTHQSSLSPKLPAECPHSPDLPSQQTDRPWPGHLVLRVVRMSSR